MRLWQHELEQDFEGSIEKIVSAVKKQPQDNGNKRAAYGKEIVVALRRQLGWTHFKSLIPIEDSLKRDFYAEMCRIEGTRLTLEEAA